MVLLHIEPKTKLDFHMNNFGDIYVNNQHLGELSITCNIPGPTGPTGPSGYGLRGYKGDIGEDGCSGPRGEGKTGPRGMMGDNGPNGKMGTLGIKGTEGPIGPQGEIGPKGKTIYPQRNFLYAKIDKHFQYSRIQDGYTILPWYHIANNGFAVQNATIIFPKRYGIYKIECGLQVTNFSNECNHSLPTSLQVELRFKKQTDCKKSTVIVPYCQKYQTHISCSDTLHYITTITEEMDLTIFLESVEGTLQDIQNSMFLCITEIF